MAVDSSQRRRTGGVVLSLAVAFCSAAGVVVGAAPAVVVGQLTSQELPGLRADVATLIMQGASGGAVDLAVAADPEWFVGLEGKNKLSLVVEVSGDSLLSAVESAANEGTLTVEFYAYVMDAEGLVAAHLARQVAIDIEDWGERLSTGGLRFVEELTVPDGELSIRSLILIPEAGRFGMAVSEVGDPGAEEASAFGRPRFEDPCEDWLPVVTRGSAAPVRSSALPLWRAGEEVTVVVTMAGGEPESGVQVFAFLKSSGGDVSRVEPSVKRRGRPREAPELVLGFQVPDIEAGVYSFTVAPGEGSAVESVVTEVWIVPRSSEGAAAERSACAWPEVMKEARRLLADVAPITSSDGRGGSLRRKAGKAYVALLRRFGDGEDLATAVDALADWERAAVSEEARKNLPVLMSAQLEVLQALAETDPESLVPLFRLHQAAYREHFQRRNFGLATHSRRLAATVAEVWIARPDRGEEAGWVADALVSLGAAADRHFNYWASQGFLERAIEIDPKNRTARLLLSMLYEKLGEYEAAVGHLEQLLARAPADAEGWLRLATLQRRLGKLAASRASLRRVIGQQPQPWILSLAYQTLVKELYAEESFTEGLRALAEAELVLPGDPALGLAKAYGLDRLGRVREAVEILEELPHGSEDAMSFRLFYATSAEDLVRGVDGRLRRDVLIRQPRLRQAVEQAFGESG